MAGLVGNGRLAAGHNAVCQSTAAHLRTADGVRGTREVVP